MPSRSPQDDDEVLIVEASEEFHGGWQTNVGALESQIKRGKAFHQSRYLELPDRKTCEYGDQLFDGRRTTAKRIFPRMAKGIPRMKKAQKELHPPCGPICGRALRLFEGDMDAFEIYLDPGCDVGWLNRDQGKRACLFERERLADQGWDTPGLTSFTGRQGHGPRPGSHGSQLCGSLATPLLRGGSE